MAQRRKRTMDFVQNDKARLATFRRRSHCLLKKASELSTLCDVDVAVLIYADHLSDRPLVFPPESGESLRIIKKLKENPAKSKPNKILNQENHSKLPKDKFCDDITSLNVDELNALVRILDAKEEEARKKINAIRQRKKEAAVDEVSDPNRSLFPGDDHHSESFDHQPDGFQCPITFSFMGNDDTAKSKSEQLIENNSGFLNQISGQIKNNNCNDEITSLNVGEAAVEEISDPNGFFFSGDDRQSALFDHQQHGFQWPFSFSFKPISEPHHLTENNSLLLDHVVPILDVETEEATDESKIINEKTIETTDCESFSASSDCDSLAAIFYDELPDINCLSFMSENPMYHQYDYQPITFS